MRVLMDLQSLQGYARERGMGRYCLAIAAAIASHPDVDQFDVLLNAGTSAKSMQRARADLDAHLPHAGVHLFDAPWPWERGNPLDVALHQRAQRVRDARVRELAPDVLIVGSLFELPITSVVSVPQPIRTGWRATPLTAVIGYDLLPFTDPECAFPPHWQPFLDMRYASLANADLILAISDYTAAQFRRSLGQQCPPVSTIWGAAGHLGQLHERSDQPLSGRRGVLCAGGGGGTRKNEQSSVAAFAALPSRLRDLHPLTIQGYRDADQTQELVSLATDLGLSPNQYVIRAERVPEAELQQLYASARLVTMPSLAEGLGLPILEAWSEGTPAIGSATTSLGELIGDDRWTFDPRDARAQSRLLEQLLVDDSQWHQARDHGLARGKSFTWKASADLAVIAIGTALATGQVPQPVERPPLQLIAPAAVPHLDCQEGTASLAELLLEHYEVQVKSTWDSTWEGRTVAVLSDSAVGATLLGAPELTTSLLFAESGELTSALAASGVSRRQLRELAYLERGAAAVAGPVVVGPEALRVGLGVIPADDEVWHRLAAAPGGLPVPMLRQPCLPAPREEVSAGLAGFIETCYRRRHVDSSEIPALLDDMVLERVGRNRPDRLGGTLYCDVTGPARSSNRSSAHRAAMALQRSLTQLVTGRVMPVALRAGVLMHETSLLTETFNVPYEPDPDTRPHSVRLIPGDILFVSQAHKDINAWTLMLDRWACGGGRYVQFLPEWTAVRGPGFLPDAGASMFAWLAMVCQRADLVVCPSGTAADELVDWCQAHPPQRADGRRAPEVLVAPMGYDLDHSAPYPDTIRGRARGHRRILVVSDLTARSGLEAVLEAVQTLWLEGRDIELVLVEDDGDSEDPALRSRLESLVDQGRAVNWLTGASEVDIRWQYLDADLLVAAARDDDLCLRARGGLAHGLAVLARDIPPHRALLGSSGHLFALDRDLAGAIGRQLAIGEPIAYNPAELVTWQQCAGQLISRMTEIGLAPAGWQVGSGD